MASTTLGGVFVVGLHMLSAGTTPVRQRSKGRDSRCSPFFLGNRMRRELQHSRLLELLSYDSDTGLFFWREAGRKRVQEARAGILGWRGYRLISFDRQTFLEHRLAWFYVHGVWPKHQIDHINEIKTDNRISNLRDVNQTANLLNQSKPQRNNTSGFRGVSFQKKTGKYRAQLMVNGKQNHLGEYDTPEQAFQAYTQAKGGM